MCNDPALMISQPIPYGRDQDDVHVTSLMVVTTPYSSENPRQCEDGHSRGA